MTVRFRRGKLRQPNENCQKFLCHGICDAKWQPSLSQRETKKQIYWSFVDSILDCVISAGILT